MHGVSTTCCCSRSTHNGFGIEKYSQILALGSVNSDRTQHEHEGILVLSKLEYDWGADPHRTLFNRIV